MCEFLFVCVCVCVCLYASCFGAKEVTKKKFVFLCSAKIKRKESVWLVCGHHQTKRKRIPFYKPVLRTFFSIIFGNTEIGLNFSNRRAFQILFPAFSVHQIKIDYKSDQKKKNNKINSNHGDRVGVMRSL